MVLGSEELERIADDIDADRTIMSSLYCGRCGYNLRSLPFIHACPECGNRYNARPLKMEGIFLPRTALFPAGDIVSFLFCTFVAVAIMIVGVKDQAPGWIPLGLPFVVLSILFSRRAFTQLGRCLRFRSVGKRIERELDEV